MANQIRYQVGFDVQQNNLNQLKASLQDLQKLKISDIMKINETDAASATSALNKIKDEAGKVEDALKQAFNTKLNTVNIETFNQSLKQSGTSIEQVYQAFRAAGSTGEAAFRSLSSSVLSTNIQLKETHSILDKMATTLTNTVKWNAASAAVNGLTRSVEQAWGYVRSLDTSLNDIRIVTGKSADEMANFAVQANNAAKELGKTTTDYTNAALIYAQQGLNDKEIEERAKITLKAANVTGQSTDAVSEQLTAVWNGYKVTAEEAELYVDRLAAVAATTASDLEELSTGMSKVASAAAAMGVGEDQLAAQLSTIISVTKQAPESVGTALRTVYARISDIQAGIDEDGVTLGNYSGKMADLGFNVLDATGHLRDMGEVIEEIGGRWQNLTREQQVSLAQIMAGQRQYSNLIALFDNFEEYNKALNTAQNAAGTLQEQQDVYMESTAAHLEILRASVEDIYDSLADTDSINGLIDGLSTAATFTANLVDGLGGGGAVLRSLGAIGVTVFSEQIAKGLNTTITNLEISKENARQFDQALQATRDWQGIPGLDKTSQDLLKNREQLLELARLMTPEQFSGMQTLLNDITQVGNEIAQLEDEQSFLNKAIEDVLKYSDAWQTAEEVMASDEGQAEVIKRLQQQEQGIQNVVKAIGQYSKLQNTMNTKMINGEAISSELEQAKQSVINYYNELEKLGSSGQLSERHIQSLENIKRELDTLDDAVDEPAMAAKIQLIVGELKGIATAAGQSATETRQKIESEMGAATDSIANKIAEKQAQLQSMVAQFVTGQERMQRAANIENYAKMAGGIAQVGSAIMQVQNLGSIWKNEDLTTGEKLLQTITNLAISLPMLTTGFTKATTALGLMKTMTTAEAVAAGISTSAEAAHAASIGLVETASGAAAIKVQLLNTTLMVNPYVAVAAGVLALVTALSALANVSEEARKAAIEQGQATIDAENKKQEEIESTKTLLGTLQELDEQYENGEITRSDLKSTIQDLIDQYGLEGEAADDLAQSYNNLAEYIKKARGQAAQEALESAKREKIAAESNLFNTGKGSYTDAGAQYGNKYNLSLSGLHSGINWGGGLEDEPQALIAALQSMAGGVINPKNKDVISFETDFDLDSLVKLYEDLNEVYSSIGQSLDPTVLQNSQLFQHLKEWLDQMGPAIADYKAAIEDVKKYQTELAAMTAEENGVINFNSDNIANANSYLKERVALIQEIQDKLGKTKEEATDMADVYLRENFRSLYTQFDEYVKIIDNFKEQFGSGNSLVEAMLGRLDEEHLSILIDLITLHPSIIKDWENLGNAIHYISEQDLSNVGAVTNSDISEAQAAAADKYNIYQSLEDQISGGKTISKKEMESLEPEVQEFFSMMANGSYKMTGDAREFYETVNNLKLQGFHDTIDQIYNELEKVNELANQNFDYDRLNQRAVDVQQVPGSDTQLEKINYDLVQQQLDYLNAVSTSNGELQAAIDLWQQQIDKQTLSKEAIDEIAEAIANAGDQTSDLDEKTAELKEKAEEVAHQLHDAMFPTDEDIDTDVLETLSETIQNIADESDELADSLTEDSRAAEDVAESILRFDNAIEDVVDNYEDWMDALNNGSIQEQAEIIDDLRDAYADLLDLDGSTLSNDFLTNAENLDLMKAAIDGDIDAYDELLSRAGQDIIAHLQLSPEDYAQFQTDLANVQAMMDKMNFQDIEIGASLDDTNFIAGLENMINAAGMTAQQATDYLASMGVDAEVIEQKTEGTETKQITGYHGEANNTQIPYDFVYMNGTNLEHYTGSITAPGVNYVPDTETVTDTKENSAFSLKVTSAHKSSGGNFKFSQAKNGGGSKGSSRRSGGGGKGRGGGGGGKGGKGKAQEPDKSQKDPKKLMEDTRDIYHDINIELQQIDRRLDRVQKKQDRLYGKQLLDNLNKQSKILDQHKTKLEEKNELQKQDLASQQQTLKNLGVTFDKYGNISNYMDILANKQAQVNAKTKEYNSLIAAYNESTDKDIKKQIAEEAEAVNKQLKNLEDEYKDLEDKIKNYDDLREDMEDLVDEIEEETQRQIEINIKKFRMEVELRLEMGEAERDWNKFRREVLEHTDIIKDTDFQEIFSDAAQGVRDITSYFNVRGSKGSLQTLTEQLMDTRAEIEAIDKTGSSAIYGDNKAQAMEDLQNDLKELMGQMEDIQELIDDIDNVYLDTVDNIEEQFDKQIEDYEYIGELIEHDINLLSLLYGDKNYDAMNRYYETLERNNLKQLDSLKRQRDFWKEQWDAAVARGDTQAAKQFEENYKETIKNLNETVEEAAKNLQNKYINAIDKIFDELDKKISNGKGTDYLNTEWELMNKNADEYLDTINTAFAIQETERKYQKALDETKSIKNQQVLKKLMDEQLGILKNKEKVTQYDVDRAEKLLQVEQARIALQDAQSAKTSMRLKRDSQGNYSYEYVADNGAVDDAQANLAQAQNDLYNFDKERYQSNLDDMLSAWRDFQSDYKDILEDTSLTEQERIERLALLREQYGEYINDKTAENLVVRNNLMESAFADLAALYNTDVENYNQMSIDEQNILMNDLVPAWESGIQQMADKVAGEGGFIPACEDAFNNITDATKAYKDELNDMATTAGFDLIEVQNGIDDLTYSFEDLIESNSELTSRMYDEIDAVSLLRAEAHLLVTEYKGVYDAAKMAVSGIHSFIQAQQAQAANEAKNNRNSKSNNNNNHNSNNNNTSITRTSSSDSSAGKAYNSVPKSSISSGGNKSNGSSNKNNSQAVTTTEKTTTTVIKTTRLGGGSTRPGATNLMATFDEGGYTGTWHDKEGKAAILHEKELVLNQDDTKNILNSVKILKTISNSLKLKLFDHFKPLGKQDFNSSSQNQYEQNVHIDATFPNVDSKREIEEAFDELVNLAAQRAMKNR